jgi:hypothetical protein
MKKQIAILTIAAATVAIAGCGSRPLTKADRFKQDQAATITTHGRIDLESVQETRDGRISYRTANGSLWQVEISQNADGTPRYGEPVAVGPEHGN